MDVYAVQDIFCVDIDGDGVDEIFVSVLGSGSVFDENSSFQSALLTCWQVPNLEFICLTFKAIDSSSSRFPEEVRQLNHVWKIGSRHNFVRRPSFSCIQNETN